MLASGFFGSLGFEDVEGHEWCLGCLGVWQQHEPGAAAGLRVGSNKKPVASRLVSSGLFPNALGD